MAQINCALFDLDGTLLDTRELILASLRHTFRQHLNLDLPETQLNLHVGEPLRVTMKHYAPDKWEEMVATYREHNLRLHDEMTKIYPGVQETLQQLAESGVVMGVVTSKMRDTALRGLRLFGLEKFFQVVVALEDCQEHKPHPSPILAAMTHLRKKPAETCMVGDSLFDLQAARAAGTKAVLVGWATGCNEILVKEPPDIVLDCYPELPSLLIQLSRL